MVASPKAALRAGRSTAMDQIAQKAHRKRKAQSKSKVQRKDKVQRKSKEMQMHKVICLLCRKACRAAMAAEAATAEKDKCVLT